ncbi:MAG: helix-turn-helix transcriptional regulator [Clostridia bacterium]|jgi:transcriptional regulator with XRE-family HTH domain|nr:helix-turn-helix transcriptional regulator [Clostridia bacterium]
MKLKDAIAKRIVDLCTENKLTIHGLSLKTGVANSTLIDMAKARNGSVQIKFIYDICAGLGISFTEFFDMPYFNMQTLID